MRAQQRIFANVRCVANVNQVVDLYSARDAGFADAGTIDARVRLHLYVVADDDRRRLRNFVPVSFGGFGEAEAIRANHDAILQDHIIPDVYIFPDGGMRVREKFTANPCAAIDHDVRKDNRVRSDIDVLADDDVRADVGAGPDFCRAIDDGCGMN